jgi:hypothetical protein
VSDIQTPFIVGKPCDIARACSGADLISGFFYRLSGFDKELEARSVIQTHYNRAITVEPKEILQNEL